MFLAAETNIRSWNTAQLKSILEKCLPNYAFKNYALINNHYVRRSGNNRNIGIETTSYFSVKKEILLLSFEKISCPLWNFYGKEMLLLGTFLSGVLIEETHRDHSGQMGHTRHSYNKSSMETSYSRVIPENDRKGSTTRQKYRTVKYRFHLTIH